MPLYAPTPPSPGSNSLGSLFLDLVLLFLFLVDFDPKSLDRQHCTLKTQSCSTTCMKNKNKIKKLHSPFLFCILPCFGTVNLSLCASLSSVLLQCADKRTQVKICIGEFSLVFVSYLTYSFTRFQIVCILHVQFLDRISFLLRSKCF